MNQFRKLSVSLVLPVCLLLGCGDKSGSSDNTEPLPGDSSISAPGVPAPAMQGASTAPNGDAASTPATGETAPPAEGSVSLTPENTTITFVGTHPGDDPKPRTGNFGEFTGSATVAAGQLNSVAVEIQTASLTTEIDGLTNHLKGPDFFNVNDLPTASFKSTSIAPGTDGTVTITGDLTLLGNTKSLSFPATVSTDGSLKLNAEFTIDRTEFGMNYDPAKVEKLVTMKISIGG